MIRALKQFEVSHGNIRLRVRVMAHAKDVYSALNCGASWRSDYKELPMGAFIPSASNTSRITGTILLAGNEDLHNHVPHEVLHAVVYHFQGISASSDEPAAYAIGILSSKIMRKIMKHVDTKPT